MLQGENDIRVPKEEAEQVVEILKKEARTSTRTIPAEGHGFAKRENQIDALKRTVAWFDKYLKGEAGTASADRSRTSSSAPERHPPESPGRSTGDLCH